MEVYRIAKKKFCNDLLGTGAALYGGRWNKKGTPVLYTAHSPELALLETIVHTPPMLVPALQLVTIQIPDDSVVELKPEDLPLNWKDFPAPSILSEIGQQWVDENKALTLKVPSCIVPAAANYLINPRHADFNKIKIVKSENFDFDSRLKK